MQINVSQLLQSPVGATRVYQISEVIDVTGDGKNHLIEGKIKLMRTPRSILAKGKLNTEVELICSRCLCSYSTPLSINIEEEYFPTVDVTSGVPLAQPEDPGSFTIDTHHILDLTEAVRQYSLLSIPMKPVCRDDCAGLCPNCGQNLNQGTCNCPPQKIDSRWSALNKLL